MTPTPNKSFLAVRFPCWTMSAKGTFYSVATGCFRESEFHRPLSGDESKEKTVSWVPKAEVLHIGMLACYFLVARQKATR